MAPICMSVCLSVHLQSLNGLQMDNVVNMLDGPQLNHLHRGGLGSHAKLERQGSKGSKGCPTPSRQVHCPLVGRAEADKDGNDHHVLLSMVGSAGPTVVLVVCRDSVGSHPGLQMWTATSREVVQS